MPRLTTFIALVLLAATTVAAADYRFHHENVLGTSMELTVSAPSLAVAKKFESQSLAEIDRLDAILSRYRADSELMRWQRAPLTTKRVSAELANVLRRAETMRIETSGAFDVRAGEIEKLWTDALAANRNPTDVDRHRLSTSLYNAPYAFHNASTNRR